MDPHFESADGSNATIGDIHFMLSSRRRISFAAFGPLILGAGAHAAEAQDIVPTAPADVREFELKPSADLKATIEREPAKNPPASSFPITPTPEKAAPPTPQPVEISPQPPAADTQSAPARVRDRPTASRFSARPTGAATEGPAAFEASPDLPGNAVTATPLPQSQLPAAAAPAESESVADASKQASPVEKQGGLPWLNILLGALAVLAGLFALRERRRRARAEAEAERAAEEAAERVRVARQTARLQTKAAPAVAPEEAKPEAPAATRPWIELEFKPETAAANDVQAQVLYTLTVRNGGNSPARNVRIEARMFNIEAEKSSELAQFFAAPIEATSFPPRTIAPQEMVELRGAVVMPRDAMRAIMVQGRALFIPLVAFNVLYEWGDGESGQTAMPYVVGREAEMPSQKMGPFRLDLGPRIYRSVGQRPSELARVA